MQDSNQTGLSAAIIERFERVRLPRMLRLQTQVARGEPLEAFDVHFLGDLLADAEQVKDGGADLLALHARVHALYNAIMQQALENASAD